MEKKHIPFRRIAMWTLIVLVLLFIFGQSALPGTASADESRWLHSRIIAPLFGLFGAAPPSHETVRKLAHVFEYAVLAALSVFCFRGKLHKSFFACFTIAFLDESLQLLTARGAQIQDVWIDLCGVAFGMLLGFLVRRAVIRRQSNQTNPPKEFSK